MIKMLETPLYLASNPDIIKSSFKIAGIVPLRCKIEEAIFSEKSYIINKDNSKPVQIDQTVAVNNVLELENSSSKLITLDSSHDALIATNSALVPVNPNFDSCPFNPNSDLVLINSMSFASNSLYSQTTSITHVSSDLQERLASLEITLDNISMRN